MKPLPLTPQEVQRALEDGKVILERTMEPQPDARFTTSSQVPNSDEWLFRINNDRWNHIVRKSPFSAIGTEFSFKQQGVGPKGTLYAEITTGEGAEWRPKILTLIHKSTEVKQVDGIWKWFGTFRSIEI